MRTDKENAVAAQTRKRAMAEVVVQRRKRKIAQQELGVQTDNTKLFRMVMSECAIVQCLVKWLDFCSLVTLVAFTDRNLRLRYATHDPGVHIKIPMTGPRISADDRKKIRKDATERIAQERSLFDWSNRIRRHMRTDMWYKESFPYTNVLRLWLDDVRGAKRTPGRTTTIFKCLYCPPSLLRPTSQLVNRKLSPLNCCIGCFNRRSRVYHVDWVGLYVIRDELHRTFPIRRAMKNFVAQEIPGNKQLMNSLCIPVRLHVQRVCDRVSDVLFGWPKLDVYLRADIVHEFRERPENKHHLLVVRLEDVQSVCELICRAIADNIQLTYGFKREGMTYEDTKNAFHWSPLYEKYAAQFPWFKNLFQAQHYTESTISRKTILGSDDDAKKRRRIDE